MSTDFSLLDKPVQFLKGVGPRRSEALQRMGLVTARDVLYHVPRRYDDASTVRPAYFTMGRPSLFHSTMPLRRLITSLNPASTSILAATVLRFPLRQ